MVLFSIGFVALSDAFKFDLETIYKHLKNKRAYVNFKETQKGKYWFYEWNLLDHEQVFAQQDKIKRTLKKYLAIILTNRVMTEALKKNLNEIIQTEYGYFDLNEQTEIYRSAMKLFLARNFYRNYKKIVQIKILTCLKEHPDFIVEGFAKFRLKEEQKLLEELVAQSVEVYLNEVEYQEFVNVLKYFVSMNSPQLAFVQVMNNTAGPYVLLDEDGKNLDYQYIDHMNRQTESEYQELLISTLINIAPQKIILHKMDHPNNRRLIETLNHVFENRIAFCLGCDLCNFNLSVCLDSDLL